MIEYGILDIFLNSLHLFHTTFEIEYSLQAVISILKTLKSKDDFNNINLILNKVLEFDCGKKFTDVMFQNN